MNKKLIKKVPKGPGVYLFKDEQGNIIYVGKSLSLKARVRQYFNNSQKDPKTQRLVKNITDVEYIETPSEQKALLLETKLIKQHQPKYNMRLKDSKSPLYIGISNEKYPRIYLLRQPSEKNNLKTWFGPFPNSRTAKKAIRFIRKIFPFRSCKNMPKNSCLYADINLCPAPCINKDIDYKKTIANISKLLQGKDEKLYKELEEKMIKQAKLLNFEEAAKIKKQLQLLNYFFSGWKTPEGKANKTHIFDKLHQLLVKYQKIDPLLVHRLEAYDIANLGQKYTSGSMSVFVGEKPEPKEYRRFKIRSVDLPNDPAAIKEVVSRRFKHREWNFPQVILIDGGKTQLSAAYKALKDKNIKRIGIIGLTKEEETLVIPLISDWKIKGWKYLNLPPDSNLLQTLQFARDEAHRFAQKYHHLLHKKEMLS